MPRQLFNNWADIGSDDDETLWELIGRSQGASKSAEAENSNSLGPKTPIKRPQEEYPDEDTLVSTPKRLKLEHVREETKAVIKNFEHILTPITEQKERKLLTAKKSKQTEYSPKKRYSHSRQHRQPRPDSVCSRNTFSSPQSSSSRRSVVENETDLDIINRRQKTIDYGKNTNGYQNYLALVPKDKRKKEDPATPDKFIKYSRRSWDQQVKLWRRKLHMYDPNDGEASELDVSDFMSDVSYDLKSASSTTGHSSPTCSSPFTDPAEFPPLESSELDRELFYSDDATDCFLTNLTAQQFME